MTSPFLLYRFPHDNVLHKLDLCNVEPSGCMTFGEATIQPWKYSYGITACAVEEEGTSKEHYTESLAGLIPRLVERQGKTVIQRTITGRIHNFEPFRMAEDYFRCFPDMFCFMFYHPDCSWWMGASPELLLETDGDGIFRTRALAGTRSISESGLPWSTKNLEEHKFVVDDITTDLRRADSSLQIEVGPSENFAYGRIEHLCTPISAKGRSNDPKLFGLLADAIHPTAAICGMPRHTAVEEIRQYEDCPRKYYSGLITVPGKDKNACVSYVVLRCVHFDERKWCIYTGSGITEASDPEEEWQETQRKAEPLLEILSNY